MENQAMAEMPKYKSHKEIWALKIKEINQIDEQADAQLSFFEDGFAPITVSGEFIKNRRVITGGYYVVYEDGYKSFSPAEAFEKGYTKI